ncbi:amino acid ABC transporter permease [Streptomyces chartreusis]|uniref:Amino acid ABC transporter permease n=1 Tax=Streptomyces chartreusis TaxID=1969 RepID=A0A7H8TK37_STRCX|nr:amino acid ABC transporter permease [Streptomyces chartreusis]QKZ23422.1 amino acid ABC transporter permease [Streptomyces chartreusis]
MGSHFSDIAGQLAEGLLLTLCLTVLVFAGAVVGGVLVAVLRICPVAPLRSLGAAYVALFRNIPLLVLLVLFVFGLPDLGLLYSLFATVATAMALYWAAFVCEVVRSGVRAVPRGQVEAARALGLGFGKCLRFVILPQAIRPMVQPLGSIFIGCALSTSLAAAVGVAELTGQAELVTLQYDQPVTTFAITTVVYVVITLSSGLAAGRIERKLAVSR